MWDAHPDAEEITTCSMQELAKPEIFEEAV
jgi:hypothetical protein